MTIRNPIITVAGHVDHGKCVAENTLITLTDGTIIKARELFDSYFNENKAEKIDDGFLQNIEDKDIKIFSFDGEKIVPKSISHIWKRKADKLIEIKMSSGNIIKTTPEHPFFTFNNGNLKEVRADIITEGQYIAIPKKIETEDRSIEKLIIPKLKILNNFICFLNTNSSRFIELINKKNSVELERKLGIKNIGDSIKRLRFRIKDFFVICDSLEINDKEAYSMIESIKNSNEGQRVGHTSNKIFLPKSGYEEQLGYILGVLAGDGHISKNAVLNNNDEEIQKEYSLFLNQIFGTNSKTKQAHTCQIVIDNGGLSFARFLTDIIGFPKKNKSADIFVPEIAKSNKNVFRGFFAGLFDTDGYVSHLNNSIEVTSKSKRLIEECSIFLLNFGIQSTIYGKQGYYTLRIANKIYIELFLHFFNSRLTRKRERILNSLEKAQSSRTFDFFPLRGDILRELKFPGNINKIIPFFNKYQEVNSLSSIFLNQIMKSLKQENPASLLIKQILEQDVLYVKVVSKKEIENKHGWVYDFTIPETHNFVAERVLVHNTSLLDKIRGTDVAGREAGGITQKISFTFMPAENIKKGCFLLDKYNIALKIPGFLFIDTPGHQAFTNLRKRGGSLADLAILVVDINEGIMPQTAEVLQILKQNKTPFVIALNKIDNLSGYRKMDDDIRISLEKQAIHVQSNFQEKLYTFISALEAHGFKSDLFWEIKDFSSKVLLVPISARTGEGIQELLMVLCGLCQKYLSKQLSIGEKAKGVILEIKKEKAQTNIQAILYDGELKQNDEIAIAGIDGSVIKSKIRSLEEVMPLSNKFQNKKEVTAATGIKVQLTETKNILPGMPFQIFENNQKELEKEFKKDIEETISTDEQGIIAKADSLGSLEALLFLLRQKNIPVLKAGIGPISKSDIIQAEANKKLDPVSALILGFNVEVEEDAKELEKRVKIFKEEIVYRLIENLEKWQEETRKEIEREKLLGLSSIFKLEILPQYVFHNSKPAIFGVRVISGKLKANSHLTNENNEELGKIKNVQFENSSVEEATSGMEVAISLPGVTFDRELKTIKYLYSDITETQFKDFKKNKSLLSTEEIRILQEIAEFKRKKKATWGI